MTSNRTVEEWHKSTDLGQICPKPIARYCCLCALRSDYGGGNFFDRWIIQNFYDSREQAYLRLSRYCNIIASGHRDFTGIEEVTELVGKGRLTDLHGFHLKFTRTAVLCLQ